jgi:hypothetical protein
MPSIFTDGSEGGTNLLCALEASAAPLRVIAKGEGDLERRIFLLTDMLVSPSDTKLLEYVVAAQPPHLLTLPAAA